MRGVEERGRRRRIVEWVSRAARARHPDALCVSRPRPHPDRPWTAVARPLASARRRRASASRGVQYGKKERAVRTGRAAHVDASFALYVHACAPKLSQQLAASQLAVSPPQPPAARCALCPSISLCPPLSGRLQPPSWQSARQCTPHLPGGDGWGRPICTPIPDRAARPPTASSGRPSGVSPHVATPHLHDVTPPVCFLCKATDRI